MSAIILPKSVNASIGIGQHAYPFKRKMYGGGASGFWKNQVQQQSSGGSMGPHQTGGASDFYKNQVDGGGSEFERGRLVTGPPNPQLQGTGMEGTGYWGPSGWVNTQPQTGKSELKGDFKPSAEDLLYGGPLARDTTRKSQTGLTNKMQRQDAARSYHTHRPQFQRGHAVSTMIPPTIPKKRKSPSAIKKPKKK